jgi:hypothetical protein
MTVGNGLEPDNQMRLLANSRRIEMMEALVADATHSTVVKKVSHLTA